MNLDINIGILVVGSLYWDNKGIRKEWRKEYLDLKRKQTIKLPICYGRESTSRCNTYTMVYSTNKQRNLGSAFFIPIIGNPVHSLEKLNDNIVELINAERNCKPFRGYYWGWGAVGFKLNPRTQNFDEIKNLIGDFWESRLNISRNFSRNYNKFGFENENSIISNIGELQFDWPTELEQFDLLITTVPKPDITQPNSQQIVKKMCDGSYYDYFFNNIVSGIYTKQDEEILEEFKKYINQNM